MNDTHQRALVLGGGGVTGMAWATGLLHGFEEQGVDVEHLDLIVGTSAGSVVGAQLATGIPLAELFRRQVDPALAVAELSPRIRYLRILAGVLPALMVRKDTTRFRQKIGRMALRARTVEPAIRRAVIEDRLPRKDWPATSLAIAAIDAHSGELRWFDAASGVSLVEAVGASCAVPGVWPPVTIGDRTYYDGGIPSADNPMRASGYRTVMVVSPTGGDRAGNWRKGLRAEVDALERAGSRVSVVTPDGESMASMGRRALDPSFRASAGRAGHTQGRRIAAQIAASWG